MQGKVHLNFVGTCKRRKDQKGSIVGQYSVFSIKVSIPTKARRTLLRLEFGSGRKEQKESILGQCTVPTSWAALAKD